MTKMKWTFYNLQWDHGPIYVKVKSIRDRWPVTKFAQLAKKMGFTTLKKDQTLVGGYYVNPDTGDCLICVPYNSNPGDIY